MISALRPNYAPQSRLDLAQELLNEVHEEIDNNMNADISRMKNTNNRPLVLMQDGWSNLHNDPILASSVSTGKETYLLKAKDCETVKKTAEYASEEAIDDMNNIKNKLGIDVFGLCTDNEPKMKRMRELVVANEGYKNVLVYGCQAHYFN